MKLRTRITFTDPWSSIIPEVARQCGMSVDDYCKRAIMLVTKDGLEAGDKKAAEEAQNDSTTKAD